MRNADVQRTSPTLRASPGPRVPRRASRPGWLRSSPAVMSTSAGQSRGAHPAPSNSAADQPASAPRPATSRYAARDRAARSNSTSAARYTSGNTRRKRFPRSWAAVSRPPATAVEPRNASIEHPPDSRLRSDSPDGFRRSRRQVTVASTSASEKPTGRSSCSYVHAPGRGPAASARTGWCAGSGSPPCSRSGPRPPARASGTKDRSLPAFHRLVSFLRGVRSPSWWAAQVHGCSSNG